MRFRNFILGANYWPRNHGVNMWKEWNYEEVKREFMEAKNLGLDVMRINLFWEDFQPQPEVISEEAVKKFDELINICKEVGIKIAPTFFVGHMSGENWDVLWRQGRNIYSDPYMLRYQIKLVRFFAERYKDEEAILFWDLSNEPDNYVKANSRHDAWLWNYVLSNEIKKYDKNHPVTLGIHQASLLTNNNFYPEDMAEGNDFLCMHFYPIYTDTCIDPVNSTRSTYMPSFSVKLTKGMGKKDVLMEEFGATTLMMSEEVEGEYYRVVLYSLLANESMGAISWCFGDFSVGERLPYDSTPFETQFGITTTEGRPKKAALEMKAFSEFLKIINYEKLKPRESEAAIIIPDKYYEALFVGEDYKPERNFRILLNSFILAKQAGLDVDLIKPEDDLRKYKVLIVPSAYRKGHLTHSQWLKIKEFVKQGGTLYLSYDGIAVEDLEEVFGVKIDYFMVPREEFVEIESTNLATKFRYKALPFNKRLILKVKEGEVFGVDKEGNPSIVVNKYGKGNAVFVAYPIELYLSYMPDVYKKDQSFKIYKLLKELADIKYQLEVNSPYLEIKEFHNEENVLFLIINHENEEVRAEVKLGDKESFNEKIVDIIEKKDINLENFIIGPNKVVAFWLKRGYK
ncbi:beta-galactosidase trimerization domain-containing protein [Caldanaerobacter sp.]|uniref:beta-galactosidase trimerization domain-containing protein n=1 Tax=Caldanaerobacter sp. TaxID=2930036 RepID=UPI003C72C922